MKRVVIAGSASLEMQGLRWRRYWEEKGYEVLDYPRPIASGTFLKEYPEIFRSFYDHLGKADLVFVMNEEKNGIPGYIGAETFAELAYAVYLRLKTSCRPEIILLQAPRKEMRGVEEVALWVELGLVHYFGEGVSQ